MENPYDNPAVNNSVPPPPPPPVAVRTMESDIKSIGDSGGGLPSPELVNVSQPEKKPMENKETDVKISIPGYEGPEEKLFNPETLPTQTPGDSATGNSATKKIILAVLGAAFVIGLGGVGYFFVYPLIFPGAELVTPPAVTPPADTPPAAVIPPPPPTISHRSYLTSDKAEVVIALSQAAPEATPSGTLPVFKEVVVNDATGGKLPLSKYLPPLVPEFTEADVAQFFEDDFTSFIYYADSQAWVGYVFKVKSGISPIIAQSATSRLEGFAGIDGLFLQSPGARSAEGFKNGQIGGKPARYLSYSDPSAALSYAWFDSYLLVSTNYAAAQEASRRLIANPAQ